MGLHREHPAWLTSSRRTCAVAVGILVLPFMLLWKDRTRLYSYPYRIWLKTSDRPVWMD